jgi:glycosyltransferase involved in cell wall biosynthesis
MPVTLLAMTLFWVAAALIGYTYCGYPLVLLVMAGRRRRPEPPDLPDRALASLSVLVAVYNEEAVIEAKLQNCAAFDYPAGQIEFLFGSDGSDDRSASLIRAHLAPNVRLFSFAGRRGKSAIINDLVAHAQGEILVFTDANTLFEPPAARRLARHFQDPRVGAVCGRLILDRPRARASRVLADETSYWKFETLIKRLEGDLGLLAAANGAIYALRRSLFRPLPTRPAVSEDIFLPALVLVQRSLVTFESKAAAHETASHNTLADLRRKARNAELAYNLVPHLRPLLVPSAGRVAWMLWSHKIIRWLAPFLLLIVLGSSLALWSILFYRLCLLLQLAMLAGALFGYWFDTRRQLPAWLSLPYYFVGVNVALLVGFFRSMSRSTNGAWARVGR